MALSPCTAGGLVSTTPEVNNGVIGQTLDVQFNQYAFYLSLGLTCDQVRPDFDEHVAPGGPWTAGIYLGSGQSFARPTVGDAIFSWPSFQDAPWNFAGFDSNYGFSIEVKEIKINPDGLGTHNVSRGNLNISYMVTAAPPCGGGPGDPVPVVHWDKVIDDQLTGSFPIVLGSGDTVGIIMQITNYAGAAPWTGTVTCAAQTTVFTDTLSGNFKWPGDLPTPSMSTTYERVSGFPDPAALFCCVTDGFGCCSPGFLPGPTFLIPRPPIPQPGEENISTPVLNKAIYLSNYTFQFVNNFGRVPKQ